MNQAYSGTRWIRLFLSSSLLSIAGISDADVLIFHHPNAAVTLASAILETEEQRTLVRHPRKRCLHPDCQYGASIGHKLQMDNHV